MFFVHNEMSMTYWICLLSKYGKEEKGTRLGLEKLSTGPGVLPNKQG